MGLREDSITTRTDVDVSAPSIRGARRAAPYAAKTRDYYRSLSASSVGIELSVAVVLGMFFGRWLDGRIGTSPWMMIVFLCFGFTAGMRSIYRFVRQADRDADRADAEAKSVAQEAQR
jgi:ATP synthase protein I